MADIEVHVTSPYHRQRFPKEIYYVTVDGKNLGVKSVMFFQTKAEALKVAQRYVRKSKNVA